MPAPTKRIDSQGRLRLACAGVVVTPVKLGPARRKRTHQGSPAPAPPSVSMEARIRLMRYGLLSPERAFDDPIRW